MGISLGPLSLAPAHQMPHLTGFHWLVLNVTAICWLCLSFKDEIIPWDLFLIFENTFLWTPKWGNEKLPGSRINPPFLLKLKAVWVDLFVWTGGFGKIGFNFPYLCGFEKCNPSNCFVSTIEYPAGPLERRRLGKQAMLRLAATVCNQVVAVV